MPSDSDTSVQSVLAPRAAIALLTLQLRAASQEAVAAELAAGEVDIAAAVSELRARIGPLVDDRRRALDHELAEARADMATAVAAAQAEADAIVAAAAREADAEREAAAAREADAEREAESAAAAAIAAEAELRVEAERLAPPALLELPPPLLTPVADEPVPAADEYVVQAVGHGLLVDRVLIDHAPASQDRAHQASLWAPPSTLGALAAGPTAIPLAPGPDAPRPVTVVLDADSFARAFAIAIAPLLEDRLKSSAYQPTQVVRVMQPAVVGKKSFWRNAWHVDVVLSGIAMVIVLAVLVAWTN